MMAGAEYPKIYSPFVRHIDGPDKNKFDFNTWFRPEFPILADAGWSWTEKIDGTNIRVMWDGHRVTFGGRSDNASIPAVLIRVLTDMFPEELLEQQFHENPAVLYGEGYGAGVQSGGIYRPDPSFILFDVKIGPWWLLPDDVGVVAEQMGLEAVPVMGYMTLKDMIQLFRDRHAFESQLASDPSRIEGVVGKPPMGIMGRDGDRLLVKLKVKDFR